MKEFTLEVQEVADSIALHSNGIGMDMDMMMPMHWWSGYEENTLYWLFKDVKSESSASYAAGLIIIFIFGILLEAITYLRNYVYIRSQI